MKLFIIGNGFDMNLGLKTSYRDFYNFLKNKNSVFLEQIGEALWAKKETDPLWSSFEKELSNINFLPFTIFDIDCDPKISFDELVNMKMNNIFPLKFMLDDYFKEWINCSYRKPLDTDFRFDKDDCFINFNYTLTLEDCYNVLSDNILYIHGKSNSNEELIFGHGMEHDMLPFYQELDLSQDGYIVCTHSQLNDLMAIDTILNVFKKPVDKIKVKLQKWLASMTNISEVVVLGHSLGAVDLPYFELVHDCVGDDIPWFFSYYNEDDKNNIEEKTHALQIKHYQTGLINEYLMPQMTKSKDKIYLS